MAETVAKERQLAIEAGEAKAEEAASAAAVRHRAEMDAALEALRQTKDKEAASKLSEVESEHSEQESKLSQQISDLRERLLECGAALSAEKSAHEESVKAAQVKFVVFTAVELIVLVNAV